MPAAPVNKVITVQPIDVCGSALASSCAPLGALPGYESAANAVWDQAGLGFAFLAPKKFIDASFLDTTITVAPGSPTGTPLDQAHKLMYGPNHGQSINPTTLNVWFVNHLLMSNGAAIYGQGFIGGNGIVMPTLPSPVTGKLPALDTLAHELGHNLGLLHVDNTPNNSALNLMRSVNRTVPANPCQITVYTCATPGAATDNVLAFQTATARNPLFTVDLARATVSLDFSDGSCTTGGTFCDLRVAFAPAATTQSLLAFKIRFLDPAAALGATIRGSGVPFTGQRVYSIPPLGGAMEFDFASGAFTQGDTFNVAMSYLDDAVFSRPFSAEFDFSSGFTSTALFDASGVADSQFPQQLGFIGTPTYGLGKTVPVVKTTDIEQNPALTATVPEPGSLSVLLGAIGILAAVGGRKRARPAV